MRGILHVEEVVGEATSGQLRLTFTSGGDDFQFHLPANIALKFRYWVIENTWQVCCAPDADVVALKPTRDRGRPR